MGDMPQCDRQGRGRVRNRMCVYFLASAQVLAFLLVAGMAAEFVTHRRRDFHAMRHSADSGGKERWDGRPAGLPDGNSPPQYQGSSRVKGGGGGGEVAWAGKVLWNQRKGDLK